LFFIKVLLSSILLLYFRCSGVPEQGLQTSLTEGHINFCTVFRGPNIFSSICLIRHLFLSRRSVLFV